MVSVLVVSFVNIFAQAHLYGITIDEPLQQQNGKLILAWYQSLGKNTSFLTAFPAADFEPEHGGGFQALVALIQLWFNHTNLWLVRHTVTGLAGWLGFVGIALCGYVLGGPWVALFSVIGLWLFPRYTGSMWNNPKDVPAAASFTYLIWGTLLLMKNWGNYFRTLAYGALVGVLMGIATAIRANTLSWVGVLGVLLVCWWVSNYSIAWSTGRLRATIVWQVGAVLIIAATTMVSTILCWPYAFLSPVANIVHSLQVLAHYPWDGANLFWGQFILALDLPILYVPIWLIVGTPPVLLVLAAIGSGLLIIRSRRNIHDKEKIQGRAMLAWVVLIGFVVSVAPLLLLHPVLYNTMRQMLYLFPLLILLGAYGFKESSIFIWNDRTTLLNEIPIKTNRSRGNADCNHVS